MKFRVYETKEATFKPIDVMITIESIEELEHFNKALKEGNIPDIQEYQTFRDDPIVCKYLL